MLCKKCKQFINKEAKFCKHCGSEEKIGFIYSWIGEHRSVIIFVVVALFIIILLASYDDTSQTTSDSYDNRSHIEVVTNGPASNLDELEDLFDRNLKKSVVNIFCSQNGTLLEDATVGGSGTMLTSDGIILTNFHVIPYDDLQDLQNVKCFILLSEPDLGTPEEIYIAKPLVFPDLSEKYDLAFLEVISSYTDSEGKTYGDYPKDFTPYDNTACLGKGNPKLGERITILGYPAVSGGLALTITDGLVSSFDDDGNINTSAKIDSGNSGGLAVDENGCMVGVPVAVSVGDYENLGEVISVNNVNLFLQEFRERNDSEQIFTNIKFE